MSKLPTLATAAGLLVLLGLLAPGDVRAQAGKDGGPPPFDVTVVNTGARPVPVTGTVSVSNLGSNPVPEPFQTAVTKPLPGQPGGGYTVPAGRRLVIEYVSAEVLAAPGCVTAPRITLNTTVGAVPVSHYFYPEDTGTVSDPGAGVERAYGLSKPTKVYADPGTQVTIDIRTSSSPLCSLLNAGLDGLHVSGYLVDVP
jgi:hypothetical protein